MNVLSFHQPWACLTIAGEKTIETRSWQTSYRGPMLVHSTRAKPRRQWFTPPIVEALDRGNYDCERIVKQFDGGSSAWYTETLFSIRDRPQRGGFWPMPLGCLLGVVNLLDIVPIEGANEQGLLDFVCPDIGGGLTVYRFGLGGGTWATTEADISDQLPFGDFTEGRYAWLLEVVERFEPTKLTTVRGHQRMWRYDGPLPTKVST